MPQQTTDGQQIAVQAGLGRTVLSFSHEGGGSINLEPRQAFARAAILGASAFNALADDRDEDLRFFLASGIVATLEASEAFAFAQELQSAALDSLIPAVFAAERQDGAHAACAPCAPCAPHIQ